MRIGTLVFTLSRKVSKKLSTFQMFDLSDRHNFFLIKLGKAIYKDRRSIISKKGFHDRTQHENWHASFTFSRQVSKQLSTFQKFDLSDRHNFFLNQTGQIQL